MTMPSRYKILNSSSLTVWGQARYLSVTEAPHNIESVDIEWAGKKHLLSLQLEGQSNVRTRDLRLSKQH